MAYLSRPRRRSPLDAHYYWKESELALLRTLAADGLPTRQIALRLGRSPKAVRSKASEIGVTLLHYGRELRKNYPDPEGDTSLHKKKRIVVTVDFDFRALTYDQRLALAEALRASVPDGHAHSGRDTLIEEIAVHHMARNAGVDVPDAATLPELDADGDPDWRDLDAAQIREMLGIPLAPVPPKPERYIPLRFRPRVERPEPPAGGAPIDEPSLDVSSKADRAERLFQAISDKRDAAGREGDKTRRKRALGQHLHLSMLELNADAGHTWAKQELRKLKASGF